MAPKLRCLDYTEDMNKNMKTIAAQDLAPGQNFIYNLAGGRSTVYRAVRVRSRDGRTLIAYTVGDLTNEFYCQSLSTLHLV